MRAHEAPSKLFDILCAAWDSGTEETFGIEGSSAPARVVRVTVPDLAEIECWLSLNVYPKHIDGGHPLAILRLWPRKPERESDLFVSPVITLCGGPRQTGVWSYGRGNSYIDDVLLDFERGAHGSLLDARFAGRLGVLNRLLGHFYTMIREDDVEQESYYDGQGEEPSR